MIVVSDTSPLNYLVLIDAVHVLPQLYGEVIIPPAVRNELDDPRTPDPVRKWAQHPPNWLLLREPSRIDPSVKLDPGEREAISLAKELRADHLLIDERDGTRVAKAQGLRPLGTLAVLAQAAAFDLIDLRNTLNRLQSETTFRVTQQLIDHLLASDQERKRSEPQS